MLSQSSDTCFPDDSERRGLQVSGGDVVALDEGALLVDDLVNTEVRMEVGLDVLEDGNRSVSASTSVRMSAKSGDISSREY